ncbi:MAG TPA: 3-methyl-2-oxobutanoate dehydrogenase subunit VorB [Thermoanaerobaculia bacterium]|nr:3-methyl-2-oxobutanoate dehydrogenase subunit VorB [Thermoanaerobaculia bacterium]HUM30323.1 3-methyl-2-oxobutanoate dehydrogenase subunit VorB [Thermoanaerobaculia bacterium]HXK68526.1 3-methyl-2-oxobutanoate dehydrogenase subunit VorB [Thermoanaerobaculia bacterium]
MAKKLLKGAEAIGEAAIMAGCRLFFGYPITPQNEIPEYMSLRLPQVGGTFVQAESEVAASNMLYGAAGSGVRVFTSSSSPGISLMMEGLSYIAGAELPCVIVNIMRAGPGLGGILPAQGDYFQATKGGGHGDYRCIVLAPWSVQEAADLIQDAFDLADYYRNPVLVVGDALIGQMMEPVEFKEGRKPCKPLKPKDWATTGNVGRKPNIINSLILDPEALEQHNRNLKAKYDRIEKDEIRFSTQYADGPYDVLLVAYGTPARVCLTAVEELRERGIKTALFRPVTLYPFPYDDLRKIARKAKAVLTVELSTGQMVEDVKYAVKDDLPVHFYGRQGGILVTPDEVIHEIETILKPVKAKKGRKA